MILPLFFSADVPCFFNKHVTLWAPGRHQARVRPLWWHSQCLGRVQVTRWTVRLPRCFQLQKLGLTQHIHFCLEDVAFWLFNIAMANHTFFDVNHFKSSINGSCFKAMLNNQRVFAKKSWSRPTTLLVKLIDDKQLHFFSTPPMALGPWAPWNLVWFNNLYWLVVWDHSG